MTDNQARIYAHHAHDFIEGFIMTLEFLLNRVLHHETDSPEWKREFADWFDQMTISAEMMVHYSAQD